MSPSVSPSVTYRFRTLPRSFHRFLESLAPRWLSAADPHRIAARVSLPFRLPIARLALAFDTCERLVSPARRRFVFDVYLRVASLVVKEQVKVGSSPKEEIDPSKLNRIGTTLRVLPFALMLLKAFPLRKEVIQPHLPIRLPCYDFTPIANPTFGGWPPYGLPHRLRV